MSSESKKKKLKNSRCFKTALKNKAEDQKIKGVLFYTSSDRQNNKKHVNKSN